MSGDNRWLWLEEAAQGPYTVKQMSRMAISGEVCPSTLFWSDAKQQWLPFAGVMFDIEPSRIEELAAAGIQKVVILGSGQGDCPACTALIGKVFPLNGAPDLRRLRMERGLTQPQMAAKCAILGWDVTAKTIAKVETSLRCVYDAELLIYARALRAPLASLYPDEVPSSQLRDCLNKPIRR